MQQLQLTHPIDILAKRYPALALPIKEGMRTSDEYKRVCLQGEDPQQEPCFNKTEQDILNTVETPAGMAEVLYLADREDFVHAYRALAYHCEPELIPDSTGAVTLIGLNNWEKIRSLTIPINMAEKKDYKDTLILLSKGPYSNVRPDIAGFTEDVWFEKSYIIRKYHELTHFISRKLFIENKEPIRDEIMADMMGLMFAFGEYDTHIAKIFLGIEKDEYRQGGRLENYIPEGETLDDVIKKAYKIIQTFEDALSKNALSKDVRVNPFKILEIFERERIGM